MSDNAFARTLLDDAVVELAAEFRCVDWTPTEPGDVQAAGAAPTGERYIVISTGGEKEEGARCPALFLSAEAAIADWLLHVREHARKQGAAKGSPLYWRVKPEINEGRMMRQWWRDGPESAPGWYEESFFVIYSRLLISDKPVIGAKEAA